MPKITKTYTFTTEEAASLAVHYGYTEKVVDESLLVDGSVPVVPAVNADGTPRYEMEVTTDPVTSEIISETEKLDTGGNPIQATEPLDVYITNPLTHTEYLSGHFDKHVTSWFISLTESEAKKMQEVAESKAVIATKDIIKVAEDSVSSKIETVIV